MAALTACGGEEPIENYATTPPADAWDHPFMVGVFDPAGAHVENERVNTEHLFVGTLPAHTTNPFFEDLASVEARGHDVFVTLEPWPFEREEVDVLEKTLAGGLDEEYGLVLDALASFPGRSYLRWAHEPEIPVDRYPWQLADPEVYIAAFRRVATMTRERSPRTLIVFGPTGDKGLRRFWPGAKYVDLISLCVYGLPDKTITDPEAQDLFSVIVQRKLDRIVYYDKPVIVGEFGVTGAESYQSPWLLDAAAALNAKPRIIGAQYFNRVDVESAWGDIPPPQWSISERAFARFLEALERR